MTAPDSSRPPRVIGDPVAAALLTDPQRRRFVVPFLGQAVSVGQAAGQLRVPVNAMLYRVQQLLGLGLLEEDHVQPRAGRAVRYYRADSALFVPFAATPFETLTAQLLSNELGQHRTFVAALAQARAQVMSEAGWGTLLARDAVGNVNVSPARWNGAGAVLEAPGEGSLDRLPLSVWSELHLRPEQAAHFEARLRALVEEFTSRPAAQGGERYLLHAGFTRAVKQG